MWNSSSDRWTWSGNRWTWSINRRTLYHGWTYINRLTCDRGLGTVEKDIIRELVDRFRRTAEVMWETDDGAFEYLDESFQWVPERRGDRLVKNAGGRSGLRSMGLKGTAPTREVEDGGSAFHDHGLHRGTTGEDLWRWSWWRCWGQDWWHVGDEEQETVGLDRQGLWAQGFHGMTTGFVTVNTITLSCASPTFIYYIRCLLF